MTKEQGYPARVEFGDATSALVLVCEHASNEFPAPWDDPGLSEEQKRAHIAWDPGALDVARGLAQRLQASLVWAPVSRLVYDLNRPPHSPAAMPERSEIHEIPMNRSLTGPERARRTEAVYTPFHRDLAALLSERLALGRPPVVITVHSFTPVYHGQRRELDLGIIHDDTRAGDAALARAILAGAKAEGSLRSALNEPYSAADGVTHLLRRHAVPFGLAHAMLELRNDLIDRPETADAVAARLAPVLSAAMTQISEGEG